MGAFTYFLRIFFLFSIQIPDNKQSLVGIGQQTAKEIFISIKDFASWSRKQPIIRSLFVVTFIIVLLNTWVLEVGHLL